MNIALTMREEEKTWLALYIITLFPTETETYLGRNMFIILKSVRMFYIGILDYLIQKKYIASLSLFLG